MKEVVIVGGLRTGMGSLGGGLASMPNHQMQKIVFEELFKQVPEVALDTIDEAIVGCIGQGSDAPNIGRVASQQAGVPIHVPACTIAMNCASSMKAVSMAYESIQVGEGEIYLIGGVESMSNIPYYLRKARFGYRLNHGELTDGLWEGLTCPMANQLMGRTAENLAEEFSITREEQDKFAMESHRKAFQATRKGVYKEEIVTVHVPKKMAGKEVTPEPYAQDENINIGLNMKYLAMYPTVFKKDGTVTPGNACPISDAAAAAFIMTADKAKELGLRPKARILGYAYAALEPSRMGLGPAYATPKVLKKLGMDIKDIDLIELNEAFASQVIGCFRKFPFPQDIVNVDGGAIALGHPVGFTGLRLLITMANKLVNRDKNVGLCTLCVGGGQGAAFIIERIN
ncbi:thiolase family protein [bacterium]|nr:thiolase family protein [candidate division CSSED10-310 bacterium]